MNERIVRRTIHFAKPFHVDGLAAEQPRGAYEVETIEESLEGLSFLAYRLVSASILLPVPGRGAASRQMLRIEPSLVREALAAGESGAPARRETT